MTIENRVETFCSKRNPLMEIGLKCHSYGARLCDFRPQSSSLPAVFAASLSRLISLLMRNIRQQDMAQKTGADETPPTHH